MAAQEDLLFGKIAVKNKLADEKQVRKCLAALDKSGDQGLGSLQMANGILLSAWTKGAVTLPIDANQYEAKLQEKIRGSSLRTPKDLKVEIHMEKSY